MAPAIAPAAVTAADQTPPVTPVPAATATGAKDPHTPVDPLDPPLAIDPASLAKAQTFHDKVKLDQLEHDTTPVFSLLIMKVTPNEAGARAGLAVYDRIVRLNGKLILSQASYLAQLPRKGPFTLSIWSPDHPERDYTFDGAMGIQFKECWETRVAYLHSADRNPAWDAWMVVACDDWEDRHAVSSAALEEARKAGYRGYLLPAMRLCLATQAGRYDAALAAAEKLPDDIPVADRQTIYHHEFMANVFLGRIEEALAIDRCHPELNLAKHTWTPQVLIDREIHLTAEQRTWIRDGRLAFEPLEDHSRDFTTAFQRSADGVAAVSTGKTVTLSAKKDEVAAFGFGPFTDNLRFGLNVRFDLSAKHAPVGQLMVEILEPSTNAIVMNLVLLTTGEVSVQTPGYPAVLFDSTEAIHRGTVNHIEFTVVGPYCEVWLNDHVLGRAIIDNSAVHELCPMLLATGLSVDLDSVTYRRVGPPKAALGKAAAVVQQAPVQGLSPAPPRPADPVGRWYYDQYVGTYLHGGHRDPAWDAAALAALAADVRFMQELPDSPPVYEVWKLLDAAEHKGCDDPLVHQCAAAISFKDIDGEDPLPYMRAEKNLLTWLQTPGSPQRPFLEFMQEVNLYNRDQLSKFPAIQARCGERITRMIELLKPLLADKTIPPRILRAWLEAPVQLEIFVEPDRQTRCKDYLAALKRLAPDSSTADEVEGRFWLEFAYDVRKGKAEIELTEADWKLFRERLAKAKPLLERAWQRDHQNTAAMDAMLTCGMFMGETVEQMDTYFERAIAVDPNDTNAYDARLRALMPRWGGSEALARHFIEQARIKVKQNPKLYVPQLALLIRQFHESTASHLADTGEDQEKRTATINKYYQQPAVWHDLHDAFELALQNRPHDQWLLTLYAYDAARCHQWLVVDRLTDELKGEFCFRIFGGHSEFDLWYGKIKPALKAADDATKLPPLPVQPATGSEDVF